MKPLLDHPDKDFSELMACEEIEIPKSQIQFKETCRYFQSRTRPFLPMKTGGTFGGHVIAQSVYVASHTVPKGSVCHNMHGYFLVPGKDLIPFTYKIEDLRNGKSYMVRQVRVYQPNPQEIAIEDFDFGAKSLCFTAMCSFKFPAKEPVLYHQLELNPEFWLENRPEKVTDMQLAPEVDIPSFEKWASDPDNAFIQQDHSIEVRKLNMKDWNKGKPIASRRQYHYAQACDRLEDNPNLHVAALLYISDRNSLFTITNIQDREFDLYQVASIDHSFVMHNLDARIDDGWLTMETNSDRSADARGLYNGRIYDKDKRLICSFMQDGVLRVEFKDEPDTSKPTVEKPEAKPKRRSKIRFSKV